MIIVYKQGKHGLVSLNSIHGSYNFRQTKFKDFSRTFQGEKLVFKDQCLFSNRHFHPFFTPKTLNSVITYFRFSNSSALVDEVSLCNVIL